tara:strand:+ start:9350 stop:9529 length:180 start_codon:yes stop_codon:yes gene_type:complete
MLDYTKILKDDYDQLQEDYRLIEQEITDLENELIKARFFIFLSGMVGFLLGTYLAFLIL